MESDIAFKCVRIEAYGAFARRNQARFGSGIAGRKQSYIVTQFHQSIDQVGNDALGAAVKGGGDRFI